MATQNSSLNVQFENCFAAVNRSPNCLKWVSGNHFVTAAHRTVVLYEVGCSILNYSKALFNLNGHDFVISCLETLVFYESVVIATGDKKGNVILWKLSKDGVKWSYGSCTSLKNIHTMSINCIKLLSTSGGFITLSCGDNQVKFSSVKFLSSSNSEFTLSSSSEIDLKQGIAFQIDAIVTNDGSLFVFAALDDCCLHIYLSEMASLGSDLSKTNFNEVFKSEPFGDWIRGISLIYLPESSSDFLASDVILVAVGSQDNLVQIFGVYKNDRDGSLDDTESSLRKTQIVNLEKKTLWNIYPESILSAHTDKVFSVQFLNYKFSQREIALLSSSFDRSVVLWSFTLVDAQTGLCNLGVNGGESNLSSNAVWEDVMRVGDVGGNDLGFYGAAINPSNTCIVAYNYTGSILSWSCNQSTIETPSLSYSDLTWSNSLTSSGHFYPPTSISWNPAGCDDVATDGKGDRDTRRARYFVTAGKDKIVRAMAQIELPAEEGKEKAVIWQEIGRPQIHGHEMNNLSLLNDVTLVSCGDEKVVRVFDCTSTFTEVFDTFSPKCRLQVPKGVEISKTAAVPALGLSNKGFEDPDHSIHQFAHQKTFTNNSNSDGNELASLFTNSHLPENTLWSEKIKLYGHGNEVYCLTSCYSDRAKLIASACKATSIDTACILLWQYGSSSDQIDLIDNQGGQGHTLTVTDLNFSPDSNFLLSVSRDRSYCVFAVLPNREENKSCFQLALQHKVEHHKRIIWKSCWLKQDKPNQYSFLTASRDKSIALWNFSKISDFNFDWLAKITNENEIEATNELIVKPELNCKHTFSSGVTALDVVNVIIDGSEKYHLVSVGLETGLILLLKLQETDSKVNKCEFETIKKLDEFNSHVLDVNCVKFSSREFVVKESASEERDYDENCLWLTTASNDHIVKLFKIEMMS